MKLMPSITFNTNTIRIPESRVVRLPGRYPHEFASMPVDWRTVEVGDNGTKYIDYPTLDPASERALRGIAVGFDVQAEPDDDEDWSW